MAVQPLQDDFEQFRQWVLANEHQQQSISGIADMEAFVREVVLLAKNNGFTFSIEDVKRELRTSRSAWYRKWGKTC
jgi:hypothetical protein